MGGGLICLWRKRDWLECVLLHTPGQGQGTISTYLGRQTGFWGSLKKKKKKRGRDFKE